MNIRVIAISILLLLATPVRAIESYFVGGQVGTVGSGSNYGLAYGLDIGIRNNPVLDVGLSVQRTSNSGLTQTVFLVSADFQLFDISGLAISLGAGPSLHLQDTGSTATVFGLHAGPAFDVLINENIRIGIIGRYIYTFGGTGPLHSLGMRFGWYFGSSV